MFAETAEHALHEPTRHHVAFDDQPLGELLSLIHDVSRHSSAPAALAPHDEAEACPSAAVYVTYFDEVMRSVATTAETGVYPAGQPAAPVLRDRGDALADTVEATESLAAAVRWVRRRAIVITSAAVPTPASSSPLRFDAETPAASVAIGSRTGR